MSFKTIRSAQREVWPAVQESLDINRQQRAAVANDPDGATTAAKKRASTPWNRVVANETVFAIAKADLLATPEQAAVIEAARKWADSFGDDPPTNPLHDDPDDIALYEAIEALDEESRRVV